MRVKIKEINFLKVPNWIFRLENAVGEDFYIMNDFFYRENGIKSPITKKEIDSFDIGTSIKIQYEDFDSSFIVTKIY